VHTHALEQRDETALVRSFYGGRDEIEIFRDLGLLDGDLRIAHGVWLPRRHYAELAARRFSVCHCPGSNLKLGSGIARVVRLRRAGIPVGIGADGPPCNNRLDAWEEIRLAARLQALREALEAADAFDAATTEATLRRVASEQGTGAGPLIHATRVAVTGQAVSPGIFEVLELVGRDRVLARLGEVIG
jgi:5-methylthioadenosine/S-adenosylhomocysteine deaminase